MAKNSAVFKDVHVELDAVFASGEMNVNANIDDNQMYRGSDYRLALMMGNAPLRVTMPSGEVLTMMVESMMVKPLVQMSPDGQSAAAFLLETPEHLHNLKRLVDKT